MKKFWQVIVIALALALTSVPAWALGLGQIQVKSRLNEPFLAHIPIISSDPAEMQELSAKLADPETFIRVGLPLPDRLVSDLQFSIETGDDGRPYIKVTSATPVALNMLEFLVEVQWSDGRLVRQYTALMSPPNTVVTTAPTIQAPVAAPVDIINRPSPVAPTTPAAATTPTVTHTESLPASSVAAAPSATVENAPTDAAGVVASGKTYGPIRYGETLGEIARALAGPQGDAVSTMQQLLRLNSEAFIGGNRNRLKSGAVLRTPEGSLDIKQAPAPDASERAAVAAATPRMANRTPRATDASTVANRPATRSTQVAAAPAASTEARLKIVAPTAQSETPTTRSGGGKQGDGDMQQQLQQANESIATKDAEINELKSRVAELEKLKNSQAQLIAIKDTQLASAQKNLNTQQPAQNKNAPATGNSFPWPMLGLGLLLLAAIFAAARFMRRPKTRVVPVSGSNGGPSWNPDDIAPVPARVDEPAVTPAPKAQIAPTWVASNGPATPAADALLAVPAAAENADHDALSRIAKARACLVIGDKAGARAILVPLLQGVLTPETRSAAEELLASIR